MTRQSPRQSLKIGLVATTALFAISAPAKPHTHVEADGTTISWYPKECCHEGDCRPIAQISPAPQGLWMTTTDGFTVLIGPQDKRRPSRDLRWHVCVGVDDVDNITPRITCIFEPPQVRIPDAIGGTKEAHSIRQREFAQLDVLEQELNRLHTWHQGP